MLTITRAQFSEFDKSIALQFETDMRHHVREFSPALARTLGEEGIATFTQQGIARARWHNFTLRGPVRLFLELSLLNGSHFDTDPQYRAFGTVLRGNDAEMARADALHKLSTDQADKVFGPKGQLIMDSYARMAEFTAPPEQGKFPTEFDAMFTTFSEIFPEKLALMGRVDFGRLTMRARGVAMRLGAQSRRSDWIVIGLMLAFGHGCISDPLYPWISNTLYQPGPAGADQRIAMAERKARTWLDAVIAKRAKSKEPQT